MKTLLVGGLTLLVLSLVAGLGDPAAGRSDTTGEDGGPDLTVIYSIANLGYIEPCG